jgi:hypothetical protein
LERIDMHDATPRRPWPTDPRYLVGEDGTILGPSGGIVRGRSNGKGYLQIEVRIDGRPRNVRVHRIVCEAWHGPQPTPEHEIAHEDGDKSNNRPDNVSWKTHEQNRDDMRRHHREGLYANHPTGTVPYKLTLNDVRAIRARRAQGSSCSELARGYRVTEQTINSVATGAHYAWVS